MLHQKWKEKIDYFHLFDIVSATKGANRPFATDNFDVHSELFGQVSMAEQHFMLCSWAVPPAAALNLIDDMASYTLNSKAQATPTAANILCTKMERHYHATQCKWNQTKLWSHRSIEVEFDACMYVQQVPVDSEPMLSPPSA